jgi:hypothetical protein
MRNLLKRDKNHTKVLEANVNDQTVGGLDHSHRMGWRSGRLPLPASYHADSDTRPIHTAAGLDRPVLFPDRL